MAKNIWVFCEQRDGQIQSVALELLGVARELAAKTNLNIWKFTVHVLLKPGLENFKHHLTSM